MGTHPIFESDFDCLTEIGKGYPQVGPMSNDNEELAIDDIHGSCEDKNDGEDGDFGYYSQESSTPPSPIDDTAPPFQDHSHFEQSQFEDEEPLDEFHYKNEYAIDDITRGIAFVLVHEHKAEKIGSANIRNIVEAVSELTQMMRNDMASHFESFEKSLEDGMAKTHIGRNSGSNGCGVYLEKAHDQLIKKVVGDSPSWRAFANVINCTNLVLSVAAKLEKNQQLERHRIDQMKTKLEEQLVKFAKDKFQEFINDMGGFNDIIDYFDHVKKSKEQETSAGSSIFARTSMVAGALALGAMFFGKS